jgi:hypothetical protein
VRSMILELGGIDMAPGFDASLCGALCNSWLLIRDQMMIPNFTVLFSEGNTILCFYSSLH